jgi:hypothetical protein
MHSFVQVLQGIDASLVFADGSTLDTRQRLLNNHILAQP